MILLAGVAFVAFKFGHGPAVFAAICSVAVFDFFYVMPTYSFAPSDAQYFVTLVVMLGIGILISELTARQQEQLRVLESPGADDRGLVSRIARTGAADVAAVSIDAEAKSVIRS